MHARHLRDQRITYSFKDSWTCSNLFISVSTFFELQDMNHRLNYSVANELCWKIGRVICEDKEKGNGREEEEKEQERREKEKECDGTDKMEGITRERRFIGPG